MLWSEGPRCQLALCCCQWAPQRNWLTDKFQNQRRVWQQLKEFMPMSYADREQCCKPLYGKAGRHFHYRPPPTVGKPRWFFFRYSGSETTLKPTNISACVKWITESLRSVQSFAILASNIRLSPAPPPTSKHRSLTEVATPFLHHWR